MKMLSIRKANTKDIPAIQSIANATWPVAYGAILSQEQMNYMLEMMYSTDSLEKQMQQNIQFFMAELDNQMIGFAAVGREPMEGMYKLHKLYVLPTIQKSGAGKALLAAVTEYAKSNSGEQLVLQVNRQNAAVEFYHKMGFQIHYEADFNIGNGYQMNDYVMGKAI
jgi:N-acetylglutamate synthase-like GNAT family acetyltransferase